MVVAELQGRRLGEGRDALVAADAIGQRGQTVPCAGGIERQP